ncbi:acetolactate synthase AlsS [Paenibacillus sabinae]|uniref:Acetolactate synthase n=1 Tax=Paenibacillus sabinae T27 TaxID=1268072 RepID=X4ZE62_9BACL|nr:acetolactate synthase AlsS [Paenibacillus sabinae]AHV95757.1 acetolactate synthase [Paenibacillus sabinae T27]
MSAEAESTLSTAIAATNGANLVVDSLISQGVRYIFGIPGAKIDAVFDVLRERGPELIVCRHEQNAAFMAAAVGRLTGKPGVCLVTSGPGASNLVTGLATANSESDPVVALAGAVSRADRLKHTHQSMDNAGLFKPVTKYSVEVEHPDNIAEAITNAFREASTAQPGAAFVSLPMDVLHGEAAPFSFGPLNTPQLGTAPSVLIEAAADKLRNAKLPVILLGMKASSPEVTSAIRNLIRGTDIPVVETFQAAGVISRDLEEHFMGRVGLFSNQPGDLLLKEADAVLTIGYNPIEYDPYLWNREGVRQVYHLDNRHADFDQDYQPVIELIGNIALTVEALTSHLASYHLPPESLSLLNGLRQKLDQDGTGVRSPHAERVHPLDFILTLRKLIDDQVTVTCDVGSHYIWMARYFRCYEPRRLLFSNGMQTLGVAMPWAIAAALVRPGEKVVSISGDGGFLFSSMELETAVRLKLPLVHIVWSDGSYNMVAFQQIGKYGRTSGVDFGSIDVVQYAESFGAVGLRVNKPEQLEEVLRCALDQIGPVVVDIPIDYRDSGKLGEKLLPDKAN